MKKSIGAIMAIVAVSAVMAFSSCSSTYDMTENAQGWSNYSEITVKDFDAVGIVKVETSQIVKKGPFGFSKSYTGSNVTYAALMDEAKKIGADDIINVRVDKRSEGNSHFLQFLTGSESKETYYATAVAIKYKNATVDVPKASSTSSLKSASAGGSSSGLSNVPLIGRFFK